MTQTYPVLTNLGYAPTDRVVVLHADDISAFQSTVSAYRDLPDVGFVSFAFAMVPSPWFPAVAAICREMAGHPHLDMGVHLTLTSESSTYRWRPLTSANTHNGLLDEEGYFHARSELVQPSADPAAVATELRARLHRAQTSGLDVTHLDSHTHSVYHSRFLNSYVDLAFEFNIPAFLLRAPEGIVDTVYFLSGIEDFAHTAAELEERGLPLFDQAAVLPLNQPLDRAGQLLRLLAGLSPGLTYIICYPAADTPELRAAIPDRDWPNRVAEFQIFGDEELFRTVVNSGVQIIGWRTLRELFRAR